MFDIEENLKLLPDSPGVYMHKDRFGEVIYVGKAISLRRRVRQYFQSPSRLDPKTRAMVSHIDSFEYINCSGEMEALILECNLIKKFAPKYNILLRDDKTYPYIKLTKEEWPRILKTRRVLNDGARYFGPYSDAGAVTKAVDLLADMYCLKRCNTVKFPKNHRPCLNYHIKKCRGVCAGEANHEEYMDAVQEAADFLNGKGESALIKRLREEMEAASDAMEFERAAELRDQIETFSAIAQRQRVSLKNAADMDIVLVTKSKTTTCGVVFFVRDGKLSGRDTYPLSGDQPGERAELLSAFIKQYYSDMALIPREILVNEEVDDHDLIEKWLSEKRGSAVSVYKPQRGEKRALVQLAQKDVLQMLVYLDEKTANEAEKKRKTGEMLAGFFPFPLPEEGLRIEAYDISHLGGSEAVGAMVVFEDGRPVKSDYRRFRVHTGSEGKGEEDPLSRASATAPPEGGAKAAQPPERGNDDIASLQEVLYRRFRRAQAGDPGFSKLPGLILMDGGIGQVHGALAIMKAMGLDIPIAGLAKDDKHRTRAACFVENGQSIEKELAPYPEVYHYFGTIQEEVHRFAIEYHRGLRSKKLQHSELDDIPGIGEKRRNALLAAFGSIDAIKAASEEDLAEVQGMNKTAAEEIKKFFSPPATNR